MRAELANLSDCAVPFLSRATNLRWYDSSKQFNSIHGVRFFSPNDRPVLLVYSQ